MVAKKRRTLIAFDIVFGALCIAAIHMIFLAGSYFDSSKSTLLGVLDFFIELASKLTSINTTLNNDNTSAASFFKQVPNGDSSDVCKRIVSALVSNFDKITLASAGVDKLISKATSNLNTLDTFVSTNFDSYQSYFIYGFYGISMGMVLNFTVWMCCLQKRFLQLHQIMSILYVLLLTFITTVLMVILVSIHIEQ
jgi:hypothetical protein